MKLFPSLDLVISILRIENGQLAPKQSNMPISNQLIVTKPKYSNANGMAGYLLLFLRCSSFFSIRFFSFL